MRKYTRSDEPAEVLSPETHDEIEVVLKKMGKTSARELNRSERKSVSDTVDHSERT